MPCCNTYRMGLIQYFGSCLPRKQKLGGLLVVQAAPSGGLAIGHVFGAHRKPRTPVYTAPIIIDINQLIINPCFTYFLLSYCKNNWLNIEILLSEAVDNGALSVFHGLFSSLINSLYVIPNKNNSDYSKRKRYNSIGHPPPPPWSHNIISNTNQISHKSKTIKKRGLEYKSKY